MALNIKDRETEELAAEVARLTGESKTRAVRVALAERRERLQAGRATLHRRARLQRLLEEEIWPVSAPDGPVPPMSKAEREDLLGIGPEGV